MKKKLLYAFIAVVLAGCGSSTKIGEIRSRELAATLALSRGEIEEERRVIASKRDTTSITDDSGNTILLMKAVKDDESGEMVATETLDAAVITARFRNVAERHGKVDLRFEIIVPAEMQDSKWQLRFYPDMHILADSLRLESVIITGSDYRKGQLKGYEQYDRFIRSIITDTTRFIDLRNLEIFIERNIPELYRFKRDSSIVSDEQFLSYYGVSEKEAIDHYTNRIAIRRNEHRKAIREKMYRKYVKVPIKKDGIRLDTVIRNLDGDFVYHYTQTVRTRPKLKRVDIVLSGEIYDGDKLIYNMARTSPLSFYISSLSSFVDSREKYLKKVIERRVSANSACYVDFRSGKWDIDMSLGYNSDEMGRIKDNIDQLLENSTFDLDSIVIAASASPEGSSAANDRLSERRAQAVAVYFQEYIRHFRDSVRKENASFELTVDENGNESIRKAEPSDIVPEIKFKSRSNGENWTMLTTLVNQDSTLSAKDIKAYNRVLTIRDADARENALRSQPSYRYLREKLYPRLRTVKFDFYLLRKGMLKDTVHTTELDTVYMAGIQALKDREYEKALTRLKDYNDFNTAIAYVSLDYNASAMAVLDKLEKTPQVNYMLAILYARKGDDRRAVKHYVDACRQDESFIFRGNLDPEIYVLIKRYGLESQLGENNI
jgi:hypothetical protein